MNERLLTKAQDKQPNQNFAHCQLCCPSKTLIHLSMSEERPNRYVFMPSSSSSACLSVCPSIHLPMQTLDLFSMFVCQGLDGRPADWLQYVGHSSSLSGLSSPLLSSYCDGWCTMPFDFLVHSPEKNTFAAKNNGCKVPSLLLEIFNSLTVAKRR